MDMLSSLEKIKGKFLDIIKFSQETHFNLIMWAVRLSTAQALFTHKPQRIRSVT